MRPVTEKTQEQSPEEIAAALEAFLAEYPQTMVLEEGKTLFDMRQAKYALTLDHGRCSLHLWGEQGNLVRRVVSSNLRKDVLRLSTLRFGQSKPQVLEFSSGSRPSHAFYPGGGTPEVPAQA